MKEQPDYFVPRVIRGNDGEIHIHRNMALKVHGAEYFRRVAENNLEGEAAILEATRNCPHTVDVRCGYDGGLWMHYAGEPLGNGSGISWRSFAKTGLTADGLQEKLRECIHSLRSFGVRHRDVHPGNLLWHPNERFVLCDFTWATRDPNAAEPREVINAYYSNDDYQAIDLIVRDVRRAPEIREVVKQIGTDPVDGSASKPGHLYHPLPFPEFDDIPVTWEKATVELWSLLWRKESRNLLLDGKRSVLDLGCSNGYFSFRMAKNAKSITAVDYDPQVIEANRSIASYKRIKNIRFSCRPIEPSWIMSLRRHDLCLFLNTHQWLWKQGGEQLCLDVLRAIARKCRRMHFSTASQESDGKYLTPLRFTGDVRNHLRAAGFKAKELGIDERRKRLVFHCVSQRIAG